jgi:hypothetical protein
LAAGKSTREVTGDNISHSFKIPGGNSDGSDASVSVSFRKAGPYYSVDFSVNDSVLTTGTGNVNKSANDPIARRVGEIFRSEVASLPDGAIFMTSPAKGDSRTAFREAMYAKTGFSFTNQYGNQYGVVSNGRLVPSSVNGTMFDADQMAAHKGAIRESLRQAIKAAREG